jgi:hypothetical protein
MFESFPSDRQRWNFIHYFNVTHITFRREGERYETDKFARKRERNADKYIF